MCVHACEQSAVTPLWSPDSWDARLAAVSSPYFPTVLQTNSNDPPNPVAPLRPKFRNQSVHSAAHLKVQSPASERSNGSQTWKRGVDVH